MSANKLTPLEALQRRKVRLQVKSAALTDALEENFDYLRRNIVPLMGNSITDAAVAKMGISRFSGWTDLVLDILPFFLKGTKGFFANFLLRQIKRKLFDR